jgi:LEA14-like dessication related protein
MPQLIALVAALLLGACASALSPVQPPAVSVSNVGLAGLGLFEQELRLDLRVKNPNSFGLDIEGVRFDLELAGDPFAEGFTNAAFELPALGEAMVPVTVNVPTNRLIDRLVAFGFGDELGYRLTGEVVLANRFLPAVPFAREGELALPRIPGLSGARGS